MVKGSSGVRLGLRCKSCKVEKIIHWEKIKIILVIRENNQKRVNY